MENFIELEYERAVLSPSDINEHLPILRLFADKCYSVTELGVRTGVSTRAFLSSRANKLRSYDIVMNNTVSELFLRVKQLGKDVEYIRASSLEVELEEMDMLFIDTDHTYKQLAMELELHGNKAQRYIAFHDTVTFGQQLCPAILEFLSRNSHWKVLVQRNNNHGLTILERSYNG